MKTFGQLILESNVWKFFACCDFDSNSSNNIHIYTKNGIYRKKESVKQAVFLK